MGCDIHPHWEVYSKKNGWKFKDGVSCLGRDYTFFSLIADVRNGGVNNGYVQPFFDNRGIPDDGDEGLRKDFEDCCDYHSPSHFCLDEFDKVYREDMKGLEIIDSVKYDLLEYYKYKVKGIANNNWGRYYAMEEIKVEEFDKAIKDEPILTMLELNSIPDKYKNKIVSIVSSKKSYQEEFKQTYEELMKEAREKFKRKKLEDIRMVYWFDN